MIVPFLLVWVSMEYSFSLWGQMEGLIGIDLISSEPQLRDLHGGQQGFRGQALKGYSWEGGSPSDSAAAP